MKLNRGQKIYTCHGFYSFIEYLIVDVLFYDEGEKYLLECTSCPKEEKLLICMEFDSNWNSYMAYQFESTVDSNKLKWCPCAYYFATKLQAIERYVNNEIEDINEDIKRLEKDIHDNNKQIEGYKTFLTEYKENVEG